MTRRLLAATADFAEPVWGMGFRLAGFLARRPIPILEPGGGKVIVVLAPHPDDEAAGCAGTIELHKRAGDRVGVWVVTDGRLAASPLLPDQLAEQRQREARCAMVALRVDWLEWLGFEEGSFWVRPFIERLKVMLERVRQYVIYTTSRLDFHPDHHRAAFGLAQALSGSELAPVIRVYQVHVPLTAVLTNRIADVTGEETAVRAAFGCYRSQWWHLGRTLRMRRYAARYYDQGRYCEPFWEMTAEDFCGLHGETADFDRDGKHWPLNDFWGMRYFSGRDLRAYWRGRGKREVMRKT
jgi:LmbE family N-acetylglucosaminyl deacetylase